MKKKILFTVIALFLLSNISFAQNQRFKDNRDGTITDTQTGLIWTKNANIAGKSMTQLEAIEYVKDLNLKGLYGYKDWRLPSLEELSSLIVKDRTGLPSVPFEQYAPASMPRKAFFEASDALLGTKPNALPQGHPFTNVVSYWYWTSTDSPE